MFLSHGNFKSTSLHSWDVSTTTWSASFAFITIFWHIIILFFLTYIFAKTTHTCNDHMLILWITLKYSTHIAVPNVAPMNVAPICIPRIFIYFENTLLTFHTACLMSQLVALHVTFISNHFHVIRRTDSTMSISDYFWLMLFLVAKKRMGLTFLTSTRTFTVSSNHAYWILTLFKPSFAR